MTTYLGYCISDGLVSFGKPAGNAAVAALSCAERHEATEIMVKEIRLINDDGCIDIQPIRNVGWYDNNGKFLYQKKPKMESS